MQRTTYGREEEHKEVVCTVCKCDHALTNKLPFVNLALFRRPWFFFFLVRMCSFVPNKYALNGNEMNLSN